MNRYLFTSDIHLTPRPQDEYRWEIFDFLKKECALRKIRAVWLLGDITDDKDNHPAAFVNQVVYRITDLAAVCPVYILKGNHDYSDAIYPFFEFLDHIPNVRYISNPERVEIDSDVFLCFPHRRSMRLFDDEGKDACPFTYRGRSMVDDKCRFRLFHQTFRGAIRENGTRVGMDEGVPLDGLFGRKIRGRVDISGDIHVPQRVKGIWYCGAPHPINFGDEFKPRVLLWDRWKMKSVPRVSIRKMIVRMNENDLSLPWDTSVQDQLRIVITLPRRLMGDWREIRKVVFDECNKRKLSIESIQFECRDSSFVPDGKIGRAALAEPSVLLKQYAKANKIDPEIRKAGLRLLKKTNA